MTIRTKICCTTYKKICTYEKKAVPLQHEKVNEVYNIFCGCMAGCRNSHIINLLYIGKFTNVNFTYSKLAKSLHLEIGAKVIKKLNTNKLNYKIMKDLTILVENKKQKSMLKLITTNESRIIEEVTTYLLTDGTIFKTSLQRDVYHNELSQECLKAFFVSQTSSIVEFYRVQGKFKITIQ